jgi:hypothetical protein
MKMNSQFITLGIAFSTLASVLVSSGCSVKASGGAAPNAQGVTPPVVTAPSMDGQWRADCAGQSGFFVSELLTLSNGNYTDQVQIFINSTCDGTPITSQNQTGTFTVGSAAVLEPGAFDLDITAPDQNNVTTHYYTIVLREGDHLFLPVSKSSSSQNRPNFVDRSHVYTKVGG